MGWSEIVSLIFGGTTIVSLIALIRFWKADKLLKKEELRQADSTSDLAEINVNNEQIKLGQFYLQSVEELGEKMLHSANVNNDKLIKNLEKIETKIDNLGSRVDDLNSRVENIEEYLNGEYKEYKKKKKK